MKYRRLIDLVLVLLVVGCLGYGAYLLTDDYATRFESGLLRSLGLGHLAWQTERLPAQTGRQLSILSPVLSIEKLHRSMMGPVKTTYVTLEPEQPAELVWLRGYDVRLVDRESDGAVSGEFICHNNLDYDPAPVYEHWNLQERAGQISKRITTLSPGVLEVRFPEGFGIPLLSNQPLQVTAQVMNLNQPEIDLDTRQLARLDYVRDAELSQPFVPLFELPVFIERPVADGEVDPAGHAGCAPAGSASKDSEFDKDGVVFTGHWVVKPGREELTLDVTDKLRLPFSTTIHMIALHAHAFAESLELRDTTTGETVFHAELTNYADKIGLTSADSYSSVEGIPLHADHSYELIAVTDNTSGVDQDMMAGFYLYLRDTELEQRIYQ